MLLNVLADLAASVPRGKSFHSRRQYLSSCYKGFRLGHAELLIDKLTLYF